MKSPFIWDYRAAALAALLVITALPSRAVPAAADRWKSLIDEGNREALEGWFRQALPTFSQSVQEARKSGGQPSRLARSLAKVACMHLEMGSVKEAKPSADEALAIAKDLKKTGKQDVDLLEDMDELAAAFTAPKIEKDKIVAYEEALDIRQSLFEHHRGLERNEEELLTAYMKEQKYSQAEALLQRMIEKRKKDKPDPWVNGDKDPPQWMEYTLATVYETAGEWKEAEPLYRDCLTYYEKTGDTRNRRQVMTNLAKILRRTHRDVEARKLEARVKAIEKWRSLPAEERNKVRGNGDPYVH